MEGKQSWQDFEEKRKFPAENRESDELIPENAIPIIPIGGGESSRPPNRSDIFYKEKEEGDCG